MFNCLWKVNGLPELLYPKKTKCVLAIYKEGVLIVYVDTATPHAWKEGEMGKYLQGWPNRFVVQIGTAKNWVHPNSALPISRWIIHPFKTTIQVKEV